jgi:DNA recombination protein RmuC
MDGFLIALISGGTGVALGAAVAYFWSDRAAKKAADDAVLARALAEQRAAAGETETAKAIDEVRRLRDETEILRTRNAALEVETAKAQTELSATRNNIQEQKKLLDDANEKLTQAFASVSMESLKNSNEQFMAMAEARFKTLSTEAGGNLETKKSQIETLVKPLEEMLGAYQKRLAEIETSRNSAYAELRQQIGQMAATQTALSTQTTQLAYALTRPSVRGQWGEITLRRLVELAGMTNRCDFIEQASIETDEGSKLRPDMIVQLPSNRSVIIDCKAVLSAFLEAASAADDAARGRSLDKHAELVRARARELSSKAYWGQFAQSPEFVVLFLPGESFLYAAVERDTSLLEDCIAQRVIIATPTTLIALLKSIEYGWRQEQVSKSAEEIRALGVEIYDRLAVLATHMDKLGSGLEGVVSNYNSAIKSLETRLLVSARKMGELGARSDSEIPAMEAVDKRPQELGSVLKPESLPVEVKVKKKPAPMEDAGAVLWQ